MVKYFCDRCTIEVGSNASLFGVVIPNYPASGHRTHFVCKGCLEQLRVFTASNLPQARKSVR